ncbi:MAG: hypothetical protein JJW00_03180 [Sulfurimonas sp.]|nr:hypothetical protein [Sulfurimonas sp.]
MLRSTISIDLPFCGYFYIISKNSSYFYLLFVYSLVIYTILASLGSKYSLLGTFCSTDDLSSTASTFIDKLLLTYDILCLKKG